MLAQQFEERGHPYASGTLKKVISERGFAQVIDKRREVGTRIGLDGPHEFEFALKLFRADNLMAKSEARRKRHFVPPSARRKLKAIKARKRAARARRKRPERAV